MAQDPRCDLNIFINAGGPAQAKLGADRIVQALKTAEKPLVSYIQEPTMNGAKLEVTTLMTQAEVRTLLKRTFEGRDCTVKKSAPSAPHRAARQAPCLIVKLQPLF